MFNKSEKCISAFVAVVLMFCTASSAFAKGVEIKENEKCAADDLSSPFALNPWAESVFLTVGTGATVTTFILEKNMDGKFGNYTTMDFDLSKENALDAGCAHGYSKALDLVGTGTCGMNLVIFPATVFAVEAIVGNLPLKDLGTVATMYAESFLLAYGIKDALKLGVHRVRPYMYFDSREESALKPGSVDWSLSFPSGHTTNAFMSATFLSYVFCQYYPESDWRIPVIAVSYTCAAATGVLRILSGNHFVTDVCAGAVIGSACGLFVPWVHYMIAEGKNSKGNAQSLAKVMTVTPYGINFCFKL